MATAQELYELWAADSELRESLQQSLEPRGLDWLFEMFAALDPRAGDVVADVGARDARQAIRLAQEHGVHAIAIDPLPLHCELARAAVADAGVDVEVVEGAAEALPLEDGSVDWVWCRDVLTHVDARRGLSECARVLRPGGAMLAYVTLATDRLEPRERAELVEAAAIRTIDADDVESAARDAGLELRSLEPIGSEWRERMIEDGTWDAGGALLQLARLRRGGFTGANAEAAWGGLVWGVYQLLGKLRPTVYLWEKRA
ncbi:MAG: class I SAM-dependent methyltransferase [Gaiellaceae bacterium]|jgi:SAM-dependent methyltransferase